MPEISRSARDRRWRGDAKSTGIDREVKVLAVVRGRLGEPIACTRWGAVAALACLRRAVFLLVVLVVRLAISRSLQLEPPLGPPHSRSQGRWRSARHAL